LQAAKSRQAFVYGIILLCAQFNLSFSFCVSRQLAALLVLGGCSFELPTRYEFVKLLMEVYSHICTLLRGLIFTAQKAAQLHGQQLPFLHFCTDFWTAKHQTKSYGTAVVAFIDDAWNLNVRTLGTSCMSGPKKSESIKSWVEHLLQKSTGLSFDALLTCTSDGASDMK
jgi:hypothetical protein